MKSFFLILIIAPIIIQNCQRANAKPAATTVPTKDGAGSPTLITDPFPISAGTKKPDIGRTERTLIPINDTFSPNTIDAESVSTLIAITDTFWPDTTSAGVGKTAAAADYKDEFTGYYINYITTLAIYIYI